MRVGAFISGGFIETHAKVNAGKKLVGIVHIADWLATLCALAGVDPHDARAAKAGLPPIDSLNMWDYFSGKTASSPRTAVQLSEYAYVFSCSWPCSPAAYILPCWLASAGT